MHTQQHCLPRGPDRRIVHISRLLRPARPANRNFKTKRKDIMWRTPPSWRSSTERAAVNHPTEHCRMNSTTLTTWRWPHLPVFAPLRRLRLSGQADTGQPSLLRPLVCCRVAQTRSRRRQRRSFKRAPRKRPHWRRWLTSRGRRNRNLGPRQWRRGRRQRLPCQQH